MKKGDRIRKLNPEAVLYVQRVVKFTDCVPFFESILLEPLSYHEALPPSQSPDS